MDEIVIEISLKKKRKKKKKKEKSQRYCKQLKSYEF